MPCPQNAQQPKAGIEAMDHKHMPGMNAQPRTFIEGIIHHGASGTSAEPNSTPVPMLMTIKGNWMLMFHGVAFLNGVQQSGPRGSDKVFSTNWFMPMAQRQLGPGTFTARAMLSFEPATVTGRSYPELFQQGETAFGRPIVDGQHPHDFIMELAALYDLRFSNNGLLSFYFAPTGDPAMGPTAYPHRASASEDPIAPLGHHLQDSTHIAADVITTGLTYKVARFEASGFHGREPDEFRWDIDSGKIDSWSMRGTVNPAQNWSGQYSFAHLTSPEALHPGEDIDRMTASVMYNRPIARGNWASTLLWGRNHSSEGLVWNGYLAESTLRFAERNYVWGRIENVDRTDELLLRNQIEPANFQESIIGRVQAYTVGYDRDFMLGRLAVAPGAQLTVYATPNALKTQYGSHPAGALVFLRVRPAGKQD
ncbi:MAG TPA: hypothetical protein VFP59_10830 [Candidatus Angelobacter sp.]|nr:hypothetical protein [Candidatus Angelobacter sp.]